MRLSARFFVALLIACLHLITAALLLAQAPGKDARGQKWGTGSPAATTDAEKGQKIFNAQCAICHFSGSTAKKIGPGMKGLLKRGKFADGKPVDDASLRVWIEKGGKDMPGFKDSLNADQMRELVAYLKTL